jgi:type II secretory pathway pseudopilin PulG
VEIVLVLILVAVAVLAISAPLRAGRRVEREAADQAARADLEAARDAKYAEIRDAEMDYRTGKLSEADWRGLDRQLRREAVELLHALDEIDDEPA